MANSFGDTSSFTSGGSNSPNSGYNSNKGNTFTNSDGRQSIGQQPQGQLTTPPNNNQTNGNLPGVGQYGSFGANQTYQPTNYAQDPSQVTPSGNPYQSQATPGAYSNGGAYGNTPTYNYTQQGGLYANAGSTPPPPQMQPQGNQFQVQGQTPQFQNNMLAAFQNLVQNQQGQGNLWQQGTNNSFAAPQGAQFQFPNQQVQGGGFNMHSNFPPMNAPQQSSYFNPRMAPGRYIPATPGL